jgi:phosphatidylethanolamine-binding protein (PEBP) family uncharacterized protein
MYDVDAPSRRNPIGSPWRHWVMSNSFVNKDGYLVDSKYGDSYLPPNPPPGSGLHRYHIVVFKQKLNLPIFVELTKNRANWRINEFIKRYDLSDTIDDFEFTYGS